MDEYIYMGFGYPVTLKNVVMGCAGGHWYPQIGREKILVQEGKRFWGKLWTENRKLNSAEQDILAEYIDKYVKDNE